MYDRRKGRSQNDLARLCRTTKLYVYIYMYMFIHIYVHIRTVSWFDGDRTCDRSDFKVVQSHDYSIIS